MCMLGLLVELTHGRKFPNPPGSPFISFLTSVSKLHNLCSWVSIIKLYTK